MAALHNKGNKPSGLDFPAGSVTFNFSDRTIPAGNMDTRRSPQTCSMT